MKTPNSALVGSGVLNVSRVEVVELKPTALSSETLFQFQLVTSRGTPSKQFTLRLDETLALDLYNQLTMLLAPEVEDDEPAGDWPENHEVMAYPRAYVDNLITAAQDISHLIGEDDSAYEAWLEEADALEDALNKLEENDDEVHRTK